MQPQSCSAPSPPATSQGDKDAVMFWLSDDGLILYARCEGWPSSTPLQISMDELSVYRAFAIKAGAD